MKKRTTLLSLMLVLVLLLAACAPANGNGTNPGNNFDSGSGTTNDVLPGTGLEDGSEPLNDAGALPTAETLTDGVTDAQPTPGATTEAVEPEDSVASTPAVDETETEDGAAGAAETPAAEATVPAADSVATPVATEPVDPATGEQIRGAEILPATGREEATRLSNLLGYRVVDQNGSEWGTASDYVINHCEAHILYMVLDADTQLDAEGGSRVLVPYELVTLQDGTLDVEQQTITLNVDSAQAAGAPAFDDRLDLSTTDWEASVQNFWSNAGPLNLTSECNVPDPNAEEGALTVHKIAYASELLGAELQSGNGEALGSVDEFILEPESGNLRFAIVSLEGGEQTAVPIRALNISDPSSETGTHLILLVEPDVLQDAPAYNASEDWQSGAYGYWEQFVPLQFELQQP